MIHIQLNTEELENSFLLFDCTGKYSADNRDGYGTPNYRIEDISAYTVDIEPPSATAPYPFTIDVLDSIPNDDNTGLEIQPGQVGQTGDNIESGLWKFRANVTFNIRNNGQKTVTSYHSNVFIKNIECCVDSKSQTLTGNIFNDFRQKKIGELELLLLGVRRAIKCGLYDKANKTIEYMKAQCKCQGC